MKKRIITNSMVAIIYQLVVVICGFILPRFILLFYGSEINGVVSSITQFISVITFLDLGVGAVVQSNLYKPLVENDNAGISAIYVSSNKFFRKVAYVLVVYIMILLVVYPLRVNNTFSNEFLLSLILILSIDSFAQYYFGITNQLLLMAAQKGYVIYSVRCITLILNTIGAVIFMYRGCSIQIVKLSTAIIYLLRPCILYIYVNKHYSINHKIEYAVEPIKQKWNGLAQHLAAFVLDGTDVMVLTLFSSLGNVSIYSIYALIVSGIKGFVLTFTGSSITPLLGSLVAKGNSERLSEVFGWIVWVLNSVFTIIYGATLVLIIPFVMLYTSGVTDVDYMNQPFAYLVVIANLVYSLRIPFNMMILASGHFKQTQKSYVFSAILNITISIAAVYKWGLVGVAMGTLIALSYQTIWQAFYITKNLVDFTMLQVLKQFSVNGLIIITSVYICNYLNLVSDSILEWIMSAIVVCSMYVCVSIFFNIVFFRENISGIYKYRFNK